MPESSGCSLDVVFAGKYFTVTEKKLGKHPVEPCLEELSSRSKTLQPDVRLLGASIFFSQLEKIDTVILALLLAS